MDVHGPDFQTTQDGAADAGREALALFRKASGAAVG